MTLTDAGARYLERARRILADVEEAEVAAEGERARPTGRLVVSAPVGFGRLHVSPVMTAYLKRYREVSAELQLEDRMINLVEEGVDLAVRIGHLPNSSLVARHVGDMRRIMVASPGYLKSRGEPKKPQDIAAHDTIQFGATAGFGRMAFCRRRKRNPSGLHAAPHHQHRRCGDPVCGSRRRPDAGAGLSGGGCDQARPAENRAGQIRAAAAADPYRLSDLAAAVGEGAHLHRSRGRNQRLAFWPTRTPIRLLPDHAKRAVGASDHRIVGGDAALREAKRAAGLDDLALDRQPLADLRRCR